MLSVPAISEMVRARVIQLRLRVHVVQRRRGRKHNGRLAV